MHNFMKVIKMADPQKYIDSYNEILPGLYLGNEATSQSAYFMKTHQIGAVVNATSHIPNKFVGQGIKYFRIPVQDPGKEMPFEDPNVTILASKLLPATAFIHANRRAGRAVLVHCHAGVQRSCAVVVAYIVKYVMKCKDLKCYPHCSADDILEGPIKFVVKHRPVAFWNGKKVHFRKALEYFAMAEKDCEPGNKKKTLVEKMKDLLFIS